MSKFIIPQPANDNDPTRHYTPAELDVLNNPGFVKLRELLTTPAPWEK